MEMEDNVTKQPQIWGGKAVSDVERFIETFLRPRLPYSLPLLRRCQFHCQHKHLTPNAEVWLVFSAATQGIESGRNNHVNTVIDPEISTTSPWLSAHIDVTVSGQTQVWVFASWEAEFSGQLNPRNGVKVSPHFSTYKGLFDALFIRLQTNHIPKLGHSPPEQWQRLKDTGKIVSEPFSRSKVLFGTIAECLWPFLDEYGGSNNNQGVTREDRAYLKYVVTSTPPSSEALKVPSNLRVDTMRYQDLQTMIDRTSIPRTIETVRQLPSIGLFDSEGTPVAWGLLGKDASISSLHTEPEYRGRGLAEVVARHLIQKQIRVFEDNLPNHNNSLEATVYSQADVSDKNLPSKRVMEKLGGKVMWKVGWIELELGEGPH